MCLIIIILFLGKTHFSESSTARVPSQGSSSSTKMYCSLQDAFHDNFPGFSGVGFCTKLVRMKTQQGTDKASKHNWHTVFFRLCPAYTRINRSGVNFVLSFIFSLFEFLTNCTNFPFSPPPRFVALRLCCSLTPLRFDPCHLIRDG